MSDVFAPGERARPDWLRRHPRAWVAAVGTVCFGAFMGQLDASIVTLTYRPIGDSFHAVLGAVQWVSLSYLAALAGLLIPVGHASDRLGRKRVYLWGFAGFTLASLGCALAPNLAALVGLRAVQGAGAALLQANSVALVATSTPRRRLRTALGLQAAAQALGLALGPTVGGLLVQTLGWRWVFAVNVPVGVVAVVAGRYLLPRTRLAGGEPGPGGVAGVLAVRGVARGLLGAVLGYLVLFGSLVLVPAVLQARGAAALAAGLLTAAVPAGFALAATAADRVVPVGWSPWRRAGTGLLVTAAGLLAVAVTGFRGAGCAVALAVLGAGLGLFTPANNAQVISAVPARVAALTGGLLSTARTVGTALGVLLVAATLGAAPGGTLTVLVLVALLAAAGLTVDRSRRHP